MEFSVFDHFPEPVFYIESGLIRYSNPAALALEVNWTAGSAVPEALAPEPDDEGVFSCLLAGREFQAAVTRVKGGLLLVLREPVRAPDSAVMSTLPVQIRELTNHLLNAVSMLGAGEQDEEKRKYLAMLNQDFYRLLRLARHLELAERSGSDEVEQIVGTGIDLAELCRQVAYSAGKLAQRAQVTFQEEIPSGAILSYGDRELLEIMLLELISNALKAAGEGGRAGIHVTVSGKRILIAVWDSGAGMTQAELTAVMDGSSPQSLPKPGTGMRLGLPIARYAAAAHGGALLLESREGQGLRCTVSLPLKKPVQGKLRTAQVRVEESSSSLLTFLSDALPWHVFDE